MFLADYNRRRPASLFQSSGRGAIMHRIASVIPLGSLCEIMTACGGGSMSSVGRSPAPLSVSISPTSANVPTSQTRMFTANVQNDTTNKGVTWSLSGNGCTGIACGMLRDSNKTSFQAIIQLSGSESQFRYLNGAMCCK